MSLYFAFMCLNNQCDGLDSILKTVLVVGAAIVCAVLVASVWILRFLIRKLFIKPKSKIKLPIQFKLLPYVYAVAAPALIYYMTSASNLRAIKRDEFIIIPAIVICIIGEILLIYRIDEKHLQK